MSLITIDLLRQYESCEAGVKYFERFYPDGATVEQLLSDKRIPNDFLFWGWDNLNSTFEQRRLCEERLEIFNTMSHFRSSKVSDSNTVINSHDISDSRYVFSSSQVKSSRIIINSTDIENSANVCSSEFVELSDKIFDSTNINGSFNVAKSKYIINSTNVVDSSLCTDSGEIRNCKNTKNSFFSADCEDLKSSLFCFGISGESLLFNQPVDVDFYNMLLKQYKSKVNPLSLVTGWPDSEVLFVAPPALNIVTHFDEHYKYQTSEFWKWVASLPNFSEEILYNITMKAF